MSSTLFLEKKKQSSENQTNRKIKKDNGQIIPENMDIILNILESNEINVISPCEIMYVCVCACVHVFIF